MSTAIQLAVATIAIFGMSARASAQGCSASASANAGDNVTVLAILHTSDPNENGEGEYLTVSVSNGGPTSTFSDYEITHSFSFKAAATAPVTATGSIAGFDGDESCEVSISVNAHHRFSPTQKNILTGIAAGFGVTSGLSWTVAEACTLAIITGPVCGLPAGLTAAATATVAALAGSLLLIDPLDMNYMVIPVPVPATFTPVVAGNGLTQADADAFNALLTNEATIIGVLRASITAANRASGAQSVGDTYWEQQQQNAIDGFMTQLGGLLTHEASLRTSLVALLQSENFPAVAITPYDALVFESILAFEGWSADQVAFFQELGDDDAFTEAARPLIYTQDINAVAGTIPDAFANPTFIAFLQQAGRELSPFAGQPGSPDCHGVSVSALAQQYGGISDAASALGYNSVQDLQVAIRGFCREQ